MIGCRERPGPSGERREHVIMATEGTAMHHLEGPQQRRRPLRIAGAPWKAMTSPTFHLSDASGSAMVAVGGVLPALMTFDGWPTPRRCRSRAA